MRYVSTRGEAPPLGFVDVTLAGLARDGGLYVPETWPQISAETIASFHITDLPSRIKSFLRYLRVAALKSSDFLTAKAAEKNRRTPLLA